MKSMTFNDNSEANVKLVDPVKPAADEVMVRVRAAKLKIVSVTLNSFIILASF